jgi:CHASE2 domain-containing sensor protein
MKPTNAQSRVARKKHKLLAKILVGLAYLAIGVLLVGWELQEQGYLFSSDDCNLRSTPQVENPLMDPLYGAILSLTTSGTSDRVSVVAIDSSLQVIQQNVCPAREFTADLIAAIAAQGPAAIAIDKFYGESACPPGDKGTAALQEAVASLHTPTLNIPLVVGASTHEAPPASAAASCIVLTPQLDLGSGIHRGLTRLNWDVLKLPLRWPVLLHDNDTQASVGPESESFSLVAARQADPALLQSASFTRTLDSAQQPYANVSGVLQRQTATDLLCTVAPDKAKNWNMDCTGHNTRFDLHNKVVVIGAESDSDYPAVLGKGMYGFDLQAHYIAALLSNSYLRQVSPLFLLLPLALYYCLSELLIPYMHIHHHPRRPLFHINRPLTWTVAVFFATIVLGILLPLAFHRFPPLGMLLGISGILIPRLLIEGWALLNERMEDPKEDGLA